MQEPAWQVSPLVHALASLHGVPFGAGGLEQVPVIGSQTPGRKQPPGGGQTNGLLPKHMPPWQVSVCVQALPSLQGMSLKPAQVPSEGAPAAIEHASQGPALHAVLQQTPSAQKPLWQSRPLLQGAPS